MKRFFSVLLVAICVFFTSCKTEEEKISASFYAMDTVMTIDAYTNDEQAVQKAINYISELEKQISTTDENSEIYALNRGESVELSDDAINLIGFALEMSEKTGGALDPTVYPVVREWGFTTEQYRVPDSETLSALLKTVGADKVSIDKNSVRLEGGAMIDLGAEAKGFAGEKCAQILVESGITSALLNLGGNIQLVGSKPDGNPWKIAVANPLGGEYGAGILAVEDCAVVTSGNYQRFFVENGKTYGHIIDPKTGFPVDNDLLSVTIIAKSGALCDALSTALFVMGSEKAEQYWRENRDFEAIFITKSGAVRATSGIIEKFTLEENSGFKLEKIDGV